MAAARPRLGVGLVGSQFITSIHAEALRACPQAEIQAVASPTPGHAEDFARRHGIPRHFTDYREMLARPEVEMVVVGAPNHLHCAIALDAAAAGKHVVMEKPLCLNLEEADRMIAACRQADVHLVERRQRTVEQSGRRQSLAAELPRQPGPDLARPHPEVPLRHGGDSVSLTSTIDIEGMSLMKPRKSRKKKPKLPMVIAESTRAGR